MAFNPEDLKIELNNDIFLKRDNYEHAGIVFCPHKDDTGISVKPNRKMLSESFPGVGSFFGKDDTNSSLNNLELFRNNKQSIMVATKAFGMGIDKPNVRFTVNLNYSSSLESFVQEAGRAGRDQKIALATILFSYYRLVRIKQEFISHENIVLILKNKWFKHEDLKKILNHYKITIDPQYLDYYSPNLDMVRIYCDEKEKNYVFQYNKCKSDCENYEGCELSKTEDKYRGWHFESDLKRKLDLDRKYLSQKNIQYQNKDYETVIYFHNNSFKGANEEKRFLHDLLYVRQVSLFTGDDVEIRKDKLIARNGFLEALFEVYEGSEVVIFIPYTDADKEKKIKDDNVDVAKAIYRMSCIGLIVDFTQDYGNKRYRVVAMKKKDGGYFESLKNFLLRYYTTDRADEEIQRAYIYPFKKESANPLKNEIHRCLAYLTEFIYDKISVKRKRAIDDMRNFCLSGIDESKDWKVINEELKDYIYYYFNSKFARDDYIADNGESFSLTEDTERGKSSSVEILLKYMRVIDDDILGPSTPIDNVKHLQGAVRLIRRSLTDKNPVLALLNAFCLLFLKTKKNPNLEKELEDSYLEGMEEFELRSDDPLEFWEMFENFNVKVRKFSDKKQLEKLKHQAMLEIHGKQLNQLTEKYLH